MTEQPTDDSAIIKQAAEAYTDGFRGGDRKFAGLFAQAFNRDDAILARTGRFLSRRDCTRNLSEYFIQMVAKRDIADRVIALFRKNEPQVPERRTTSASY